MIDTHCHLTFDVFKDMLPSILKNAKNAGINQMLTVATTTDSLKDVQELSSKEQNIFCSAGIHPLHADESTHWADLEEAIENPRTLAWGELGLDQHYPKPCIQRQLSILNKQLDLIEKHPNSKPIIIHCRKAFETLIPILKKRNIDSSRFVFHCFTGTEKEAEDIISFGSMISFTGIITYPSGKEILISAKQIPLDRIMVETDAPFLTPVPIRGQWPCEPAHVTYTAKKIASARRISIDEFEKATDNNAKRFFNFPEPL